MKKKKLKKVLDNRGGFTLVELLVVIAIALILSATAVAIYSHLQITSQLNENTSLVIQTLRTAREKSVGGFNNEAYGVKFQADRFTLYQNAVGSDYDRVFVLDNALSLSWSLTGGVDNIDFSKGLGVPDAIGTVTLTHETSGTQVININSFGVVEKE